MGGLYAEQLPETVPVPLFQHLLYIRFCIQDFSTQLDIENSSLILISLTIKPEKARLELIRDVFVFQCMTGLAFIDVYNLRQEHIVKDNGGNWWIRKTREKTNNMCNIPLLSLSIQILKKYENHPHCIEKGVLPPVMCNQKMNSYLKEIADLCGIKKRLSTH